MLLSEYMHSALDAYILTFNGRNDYVSDWTMHRV